MSDTYMMAEEYDSESMALDAADAIGEVFTSAIVSEVYSARHGRQDTTFYVDTPGGKRFTFTVTESTDIQVQRGGSACCEGYAMRWYERELENIDNLRELRLSNQETT